MLAIDSIRERGTQQCTCHIPSCHPWQRRRRRKRRKRRKTCCPAPAPAWLTAGCFYSNFARDPAFVHKLALNIVSTHYNHVQNTDIHSYAIVDIYINFLWRIHVGKVIFRLLTWYNSWEINICKFRPFFNNNNDRKERLVRSYIFCWLVWMTIDIIIIIISIILSLVLVCCFYHYYYYYFYYYYHYYSFHKRWLLSTFSHEVFYRSESLLNVNITFEKIK